MNILGDNHVGFRCDYQFTMDILSNTPHKNINIELTI